VEGGEGREIGGERVSAAFIPTLIAFRTLYDYGSSELLLNDDCKSSNSQLF